MIHIYVYINNTIYTNINIDIHYSTVYAFILENVFILYSGIRIYSTTLLCVCTLAPLNIVCIYCWTYICACTVPLYVLDCMPVYIKYILGYIHITNALCTLLTYTVGKGRPWKTQLIFLQVSVRTALFDNTEGLPNFPQMI